MGYITVTNTFTNSTTADATQVNTNFTDIINGTSDGTKDFSISALTVAGTATFNGAVTLGNATGDDITITGSLASSVPLKAHNSYDIGSVTTLGLRAIYFASSSATKTAKLQGPAAAADVIITLPDTTGTLLYDGQIASQAEQETGSATDRLVSPGRQQFHPSASKIWCSYTTVTSTSAHSAYNLTSLTDNGTGDTTVNIATDMSAVNQTFVASSYDNGSGAGSIAIFKGSIAVGSVQIVTVNPTTLAAADSAYVGLEGFGDQ